MAKFFQLYRERAAALHGHLQMQLGADIHHRCFESSIPFNNRILPGCSGTIEVPVLEKKQRFDQKRRNFIEFVKQKLRLAVAKQRRAIKAADFEAGIRAFRIRRRDTVLEKRQHGLRLANLVRKPISLGCQAGLE